MLKIAPSILSANFARLGDEIAAVEAAGADYIHVDVMDGHFVPNLTIGPLVVRALRDCSRITRPLDVHLMISPVDPYIKEFAQAGAGIITIHAEATHHLDRTLNLVRDHGCRVGVALNPATPLAALEEVIGIVDLILIMTVNPGFGGQKFIPSTLDKIRRASQVIAASGRAIELEVDGGITPATIGAAWRAGARVFVAGSAVFNTPEAPDYAPAIAALRRGAETP